MFTGFDKAIVATIMAILILIEQFTGWKIGWSEEGITTILAILTPILVWWVPNKKPETETQ